MANGISEWIKVRARRPAYVCGLIATVLSGTVSAYSLYKLFHERPEAERISPQPNGWKLTIMNKDNIFSVAIVPVPLYPASTSPLPPWFGMSEEAKTALESQHAVGTNSDALPEKVPLPRPRPQMWERNYAVWVLDSDQGDDPDAIKLRREWRSCDVPGAPPICAKSAAFRRDAEPLKGY